MPIRSLAELADVVQDWPDRRRALYIRWTDDIERDVRTGVSRDELTGIELPGLSVNGLVVESWWGDRPLVAWLARRLYDYRHLPDKRGPHTRPWVVSGVETGRGPDNEPLIGDCTVVDEIAPDVVEEGENEVARLGDDWGTLDRT